MQRTFTSTGLQIVVLRVILSFTILNLQENNIFQLTLFSKHMGGETAWQEKLDFTL
ncbi:uncharacterized protein P174DRAFT_417129 [Aspergillus novofumigatus IBT 16806]|uniref:Uncharacterized protein n=1 Tax=Aspergillus novofumigatus (strain IBT 16806) TaxID=1392255 RepID=A0A2I1CPC1_ASPN1|nr:uncharacterized protein P174DRAFT_417129 [Aspergillus novofumigatus IBT 16806]PKX99453.1 hypothetical protein P174DRAFT_417129 [Aspergillus novofumigatus IBT 16806]